MTNRLRLASIVCLCVCASLGASGCRQVAVDQVAAVAASTTQSSTPEPSATNTATPTATQTATATSTPTVTPTHTPPPAPNLASSYPIDGDLAVPADRPLVFSFDRAMSAESISSALVISPTTPGSLVAESDTVFRFVPADNWQPEVAYSVVLDTTAASADGALLASSASLSFAVGGRGVSLPVLMYHHLTDLDEDATEGQRTWTVAPAEFRAQMAYIAGNGWQTISPDQLADYFALGAPLPAKPLMITMDDGYSDVYTVAYPVLAETDLRPVLFIVPEYVGYGAYLTWSQLSELVAGGFVVGAHGLDHSNLRQADDVELERQIVASGEALSEELGITVTAFCYPYGSYDDRALTLLAENEYRTAFTLNPTRYQQPDAPLQINRLCVSYGMSVDDVANLLD